MGREAKRTVVVAVLMVTTLAGLGCSTPTHLDERRVLMRPTSTARPIEPIPLEIALDEARVALGDRLFHDTRLSHDDTIACASCHALDGGGVDGLATSVGIGGAVGPINAPTVFNAGFFFRQFWDGRAPTLEDQASGPVHAPLEMGSSWEEALPKLRHDHAFMADFVRTYPAGLTPETVTDAIATFERSLITPSSRFDRWLRGDEDVLSDDELSGFRMFSDYGCVACHQGVAMGGNMYQRFGVMGDYFGDRGDLTDADRGRFNVTQREEDRYVFKVPSLRNIALTAPYFHDGSAASLEDAVVMMGRYQLGRELDDREVSRIVAFLLTLTGEYRGRPLR